MRNGNNNVESSSFLFLCKFKSVWKEYKEKDLGHKLFFSLSYFLLEGMANNSLL